MNMRKLTIPAILVGAALALTGCAQANQDYTFATTMADRGFRATDFHEELGHAYCRVRDETSIQESALGVFMVADELGMSQDEATAVMIAAEDAYC